MIKEKLLFVDDENDILQSMKRFLNKKINLVTAESAGEALKLLDQQDQEKFAVIISDMRMPGMDGITLLAKAKEKYPDTVRLILTGNADLETAMEAVNTGQVFKFLTKPISEEALLLSIKLAVEQYRLVTAEKQLINQTLKGSIRVLCELLSFADPTAFRSGNRIKHIVNGLAGETFKQKMWQLDIAALMSQLGCITIPGDILKKIHGGFELSDEEQKLFGRHPQIGAKMINQIPRLDKVAKMIEYQMKRWDWFSEQKTVDKEVSFGAQVLKIAFDYDHLLQIGMDKDTALINLSRRKGVYSPDLLNKLSEITVNTTHERVQLLNFQDIVPGMIADEDIVSQNGALIISKGQEITWPAIQGLNNFIDHIGIKEPIRIRVLES